MTARMKGWTVTAFPDKRFHHHRLMGTAERSDVAPKDCIDELLNVFLRVEVSATLP